MARRARIAPLFTCVLALAPAAALRAETAPGGAADPASCVGKARLRGDVFEQGAARLKDAELPVLDLIAQTLNERCAGKRIEIQAHVDASGEPGRDQQLSQARADEVKRRLEERGVAAERLRAVGYGSTRPESSASELRGLDARVTFVVEGE
jgi:outer membrane protein OmpA-like peptidoglycan-associated protein